MKTSLLFTLFAFVGLLLAQVVSSYGFEPVGPLQPKIDKEDILIWNNSLKEISSPVNPIFHEDLIGCLIRFESSGNHLAIGDNGKSRGILQFQKPTFERYKEKYELSYLRYDNERDQIILADQMLQENFGNITHWTVYPLCVK